MLANPCCCCTFASDTFNRADSSSLGSLWTQDAGSWSIVSNTLQTSSANAELTCTTPNPVGDAFVKVQAFMVSSADGDSLRLTFDRLDKNNYKYAEFVWDATNPVLNIGHRTSGTDTIDATLTGGAGTFSLTPGSAGGTVAVCFSSSFVASITLENTAWLSFNFGASGGNPGVGLATGAMSGTATFDDFAASKMKDGCPDCGASCVYGSALPPRLKFVMSGWSDNVNFIGFPPGVSGTMTCTTCYGCYDATVYLTSIPSQGAPDDGCYWIGSLPVPCIDAYWADGSTYTLLIIANRDVSGNWFLGFGERTTIPGDIPVFLWDVDIVAYTTVPAIVAAGPTGVFGVWSASAPQVDTIGSIWNMNLGNPSAWLANAKKDNACTPPTIVTLEALAS